MMNSLIEALFLHRISKEKLLENTKIARDGHIELIPKPSYAEGNYLLKPSGKNLVVSVANLSFRRPFEYLVKDQPEYFLISLSPRFAGIGGILVDKQMIFRQHIPTGFVHCGVGVLFLPEFIDTILNSRYGISPDEVVLAIDALGKFPLIPAAAVILKQLGEASFSISSLISVLHSENNALPTIILSQNENEYFSFNNDDFNLLGFNSPPFRAVQFYSK
jgi:hypothetical protein